MDFYSIATVGRNSMGTDQHPSPETLAGFTHHPKANEYKFVHQHLSYCRSCRRQSDQYIKLVSALKALPVTSYDSMNGEHLNDEDALRYINGNQYENVHWREHVKECDQCKHRLLLLRARKIAKGHEKNNESQTTVTHIAIESTNTVPNPDSVNDEYNGIGNHHIRCRRERIGNTFAKRNVLKWLALPASVAAGLLLTVFFWSHWQSESIRIISYQDDPLIYFTPQQQSPGIGFFSSAQNHEKPFSGMTISQKGETYSFRWLAENDAIQYRFRLYSVLVGSRRLVFEKLTSKPQVDIDKIHFRTKSSYEWELSGEIAGHQRFVTNGGFLVVGN